MSMEVITPGIAVEKQIEEIAEWLCGDSGVPPQDIILELTAWVNELIGRVKSDSEYHPTHNRGFH